MKVSHFWIVDNCTKRFWLLPMVLVFLGSNAQSIDYSEKELVIDSKLLDEQRKVKIYFPNANNNSKMAIYVLDGNWNYDLVKGVATHWVRWGLSSDIVVIGIDNMGFRTRDLTPTNDEKRYPGSGGAPSFLGFVKNELKPLINKEVGSLKSELLFGHSFGGLFSLYVLKENPALFDGYIAVSPSLWWKDRFMFGKHSFEHDNERPFVYTTAGTNDRGNTKVNKEYVDWLRSEGYAERMELHSDIFQGENHFSNVSISLHHAFKKLFARDQWSAILISIYENAGLDSLKTKMEAFKSQHGIRFSFPTDAILAKSLQLNDNQSHDKAIELLKWAQLKVEEEYRPSYYLGHIYKNRKDTVNAIHFYQSALHIGGMPGRMQTVITRELQKLKVPSQMLVPFSTDEVETSIAFTPDENIAFVSRHKGKWGQMTNPPSTIYEYQKTDNAWKLIGPAFMGNLNDGNSDSDVFVSYDGAELFFVSDRRYEGKNNHDGDIWKSTWVDGKWTDPSPVTEVNSKGYEASPVTDSNGNLYFSSMREGGKGLGDIYLAKRKRDGTYDKPEPVKGHVNAESGEWNLIVGPEADWMVFESSGRSDGMSSYGDLYLSKNVNGMWTKPMLLKDLNSTGSDLNPRFLIESGRLVFISSKNLKSTNANVYEVKKDLWAKYVQTDE